SNAVFAAQNAGCAQCGIFVQSGGRNRANAGTQPGPGLLPVYELYADEGIVRTGARPCFVSIAAARNGAAVGVAGAVQEYRGSGFVRDGQLLAGRGRAGRTVVVSACGPSALWGG